MRAPSQGVRCLVVGVRPDFVIEVRRDVLDEQDGPTLQHALQGVHGSELLLPPRRSARPRADLLEERYEDLQASWTVAAMARFGIGL